MSWLVWSVWLLLALEGLAANFGQNRREQRTRVTRMSVLDFWEKETAGDGLNLTWGHHINSWSLLNQHKRDTGMNRSMLIEGDVFLMRSSGTPVMALPPVRNQTVTFKQWLKVVALAQKAIMVNFRTTAVVKPALQYLFAYQQLLKSPVILHANIRPGPASFETPVKADFFVKETSEFFPDATLAVGWTKAVPDLFPDLSPSKLRYSWRDIFDMLQHTFEIHQPVMYSVRTSFACYSFPQLSFLLGIRRSFSLLIWSEEDDEVKNWAGLVALRRFSDSRQVLYDLHQKHRLQFLEAFQHYAPQIELEDDRRVKNWRVVEFLNPSALLSTIIPSTHSVAFLGWPTAFLLSETILPDSKPQLISGRVLFVKKPDFKDVNPGEQTGLSIFLLNSVEDIGQPLLDRRSGVQIFLGVDGRIWIRNRDSAAAKSAYLPRAVSQMVRHECYGFEARVTPRLVQLRTWTAACAGSPSPTPRRSWRRHLTLLISARHRHVALQKTGDGTVDVLLQGLRHANSSSSIPIVLPTFAIALFVVLKSFSLVLS